MTHTLVLKDAVFLGAVSLDTYTHNFIRAIMTLPFWIAACLTVLVIVKRPREIVQLSSSFFVEQQAEEETDPWVTVLHTETG